MLIGRIVFLVFLMMSCASLSLAEIPREIEGIRLGMEIAEITEKYNVHPEDCPSGCGEGEFYIFIHENRFSSVSGKSMSFEMLTRAGRIREFWADVGGEYGMSYYKRIIDSLGQPNKMYDMPNYKSEVWMDNKTELFIHVNKSDGSVSLIGLRNKIASAQ